MGTISKNFSFSEFERTSYSQYAIENKIKDADVRDNICSLVSKVLQPLRDVYGHELVISSGYRCPGLNNKVGGVSNSQHLKGEAADVQPRGPFANDPVALAALARELGLPFDQMIVYNTFVHFSHKRDGAQRCQELYDKKYTGPKIESVRIVLGTGADGQPALLSYSL